MNDSDNPRQLVAQLFSRAWQEASAMGISNDLIASTALSAALASLVKTCGQEAAARMADRLSIEIRSGKFDHDHPPGDGSH